jgi:hypothetical protein
MGVNLRANVNAEGSSLFHDGNINDKTPRHYKITNLPGCSVLTEVKHIEDKELTFSHRNAGDKATTLGASISGHTVTQLGRVYIKPGSRYKLARINTHDVAIIWDGRLTTDLDFTAIGQVTFNKVKSNSNNTYNEFIE